jgi:hypothetical protein
MLTNARFVNSGIEHCKEAPKNIEQRVWDRFKKLKDGLKV